MKENLGLMINKMIIGSYRFMYIKSLNLTTHHLHSFRYKISPLYIYQELDRLISYVLKKPKVCDRQKHVAVWVCISYCNCNLQILHAVKSNDSKRSWGGPSCAITFIEGANGKFYTSLRDKDCMWRHSHPSYF